jgi:hypothetical protein
MEGSNKTLQCVIKDGTGCDRKNAHNICLSYGPVMVTCQLGNEHLGSGLIPLLTEILIASQEGPRSM